MSDSSFMSQIVPPLIDIFASSVAGSLSTLVGHPLDTVKVRIQIKKEGEKPSALQVMREIRAREGMIGFFKGVSSPIYANIPMNAVLFTVNSTLNRYFKDGFLSKPAFNFFSGVISGCFATLTLLPFQVMKCQMQECKERVIGFPEAFRRIMKSQGIIGFTRGGLAMCLRDILPYGAFFFTFEKTRSIFGIMEKDTSLKGIVVNSLGGGIAGIVVWTLGYPFDICKTIQQTSKNPPSTFAIMKQIYMESGLKGYYRGFSPCLVRAFPVNAVLFASYDLLSSLLHS